MKLNTVTYTKMPFQLLVEPLFILEKKYKKFFLPKITVKYTIEFKSL